MIQILSSRDCTQITCMLPHKPPVFIADIVNWSQHSAAPDPSHWTPVGKKPTLGYYWSHPFFMCALCLLQVLCPCPQNGKSRCWAQSALLNVWCMTPAEAAWRRKRRLERQAGRVYVEGIQPSDWHGLELGTPRISRNRRGQVRQGRCGSSQGNGEECCLLGCTGTSRLFSKCSS